MHGYTPRKPLDLLPMSPHAKISESAETFARHIHDLHNEIRKKIQVILNIKFMLTLIDVIQSFK